MTTSTSRRWNPSHGNDTNGDLNHHHHNHHPQNGEGFLGQQNSTRNIDNLNVFEDSGGWQDMLLEPSHDRRRNQPHPYFRSSSSRRFVGDRPYLSRNRSEPVMVNHHGLTANNNSNTQYAQNYQPDDESDYDVQMTTPTNALTDISSRLHDAARICNWTEVKKLAQTSPSLAKFVGNEKSMALHHVCSRRPRDAKVVELLLRAYPDALLAQDNKGYNPLHYACRFKASVEVIQLLLHLYPKRAKKAVQMEDNIYRRKPLFFAVRYDAPEGVMELLLDVDSSSVLEEDLNQESPLSLVWTSYRESSVGKKFVEKYKEKALRGEQIIVKPDTTFAENWNKVEFLLQYALKGTYPLQNNHPKDWKMLHATASVQCHNTLFLISMGLHREQIREIQGATGRTALHCAALSPATGATGLTVISHLLKDWPEASRIQDTMDKSLPLHLVAENADKCHWSTDGANYIYSVYPEAVSIKDDNERLPLHRACMAVGQICQNKESGKYDNDDTEIFSVLRELLMAFPKGCEEQDVKGQIPLHIVAASTMYDYPVNLVYSKYPSGVELRDNKGRLPIHLAASNPHASHDLIVALLKHHPRGARMFDGEDRLPFHLACGAGHSWGPKIQAIYDAYPSALNMIDQSPKRWNPLHHACASPRNAGHLINALVGLYSTTNTLDKMIRMRDSDGRYPIHLACASGKTWEGGIGILFQTCSDTLHEVDGFGLWPWHASILNGAKVSGDCEQSNPSADEDDEQEIDLLDSEEVLDKINTSFKLLKKCPHVLKHVAGP